MDLNSLRTLFAKWLPGFLSILVAIGLAVLFVAKILPAWQSYQALSDTVNTQQTVISTQTAAQNGSDNQVILQHLIDDSQNRLNTVGDNFLTQAEAQQVLNRVYDYAYSRGVRITSLQAQPSAQPTDTNAAPYAASLFQLQVTGGVANLIDFISHFREASMLAVNIVTMSVTRADNQSQLTMLLQIDTSPYASGHALSQLPTQPPILEATTKATELPSPTATPTILPTATATPLPTTITQIAALPTTAPSLIPTLSVTFPPTFTPTFAPTSSPTDQTIACTGAQSSLFKVGDIAIVHFNGLGALRVLSDPNASVMSTRTQAYDKHRLEIIAGPVCANSSYYWYIRNLSQNNALGWVAEGKENERWLCPESNPVCSS